MKNLNFKTIVLLLGLMSPAIWCMKTNRIIAFFALMLSFIPSFSQERGFFRVYERDDQEVGPCDAIELPDGNFIIAINHIPIWNYEICGELVKLSPEGELLGCAPITDENGYCRIDNLFPHPNVPGTFIGMGLLVDTEVLPNIYRGQPLFIQFDGDLNITMQACPQWPEEYQDLVSREYVYNTLLDNESPFSLLHCKHLSSGASCRLFTQFTPDGEFERIVQDTTSLAHFISEAVFQFPDKSVGVLRPTPGASSESVHTLFKLNKDYEADRINEYYQFAYDTAIYYNSIGQWIEDQYSIYLMDFVKFTILPLNDSSLLFSARGDESLYRWIDGNNQFFLNHSAILFKTDLEGNIQQHCVVGSLNDTIEDIPIRSVALSDTDPSGQKYIYHCCSTEGYAIGSLVEDPNTMTITKFTEDFEIVWRKRYTLPNIYLMSRHVLATSDGGCLVVGYTNRNGNPYLGHHELFALKLGSDGTVGTDEITVTDEIFFYPNPARDVLHLHYPQEMQPAQIELYDLQGRLVRSQTTSFKSLSMEGLAAGQYVLKVTLENGKEYTDKVVKE